MRCIGVDLAWGANNTTGIVVLEQGTGGAYAPIAQADALTDDSDILAFIDAHDTGGGVVVALDAPTLVPNQTGKRPCETECQRLFGKFQAGPHPSNKTLLRGNVRGERLAGALETRGVLHDPYWPKPQPDDPPLRRVIEVFPHPAHVVLFDLPRTLKYKTKPGRTKEFLRSEFDRYVQYLAALSAADPPLTNTDDLLRYPDGAMGKALKRYEDTLDALTCAYVAAYCARWGADGMQVLGDLDTGHIVVPKRLAASVA